MRIRDQPLPGVSPWPNFQGICHRKTSETQQVSFHKRHFRCFSIFKWIHWLNFRGLRSIESPLTEVILLTKVPGNSVNGFIWKIKNIWNCKVEKYTSCNNHIYKFHASNRQHLDFFVFSLIGECYNKVLKYGRNLLGELGYCTFLDGVVQKW